MLIFSLNGHLKFLGEIVEFFLTLQNVLLIRALLTNKTKLFYIIYCMLLIFIYRVLYITNDVDYKRKR